MTLASVAQGAAAEDFYKGKNIPHRRWLFGRRRLLDTYARTIARHLGKHIPGDPSVVVENMTGAGSLIAANHVFRVA